MEAKFFIPPCFNPRGVFMSVLKKIIRYKTGAISQSKPRDRITWHVTWPVDRPFKANMVVVPWDTLRVTWCTYTPVSPYTFQSARRVKNNNKITVNNVLPRLTLNRSICDDSVGLSPQVRERTTGSRHSKTGNSLLLNFCLNLFVFFWT